MSGIADSARDILTEVRDIGPSLAIMTADMRDLKMAEMTSRLDSAFGNQDITMAEYVEAKRILGLGMAGGVERRIYYR